MNICFLTGTITNEPNFKFTIDKNHSFKKNKHFSICYFNLEVDSSTSVIIKAYDEFADFCYSNLKRGDDIAVSRNR